MTEEEKEAKENLKKNRGVSFKEADVLSNLIENQQKEIQQLRNKLEFDYVEAHYINKDKIRKTIEDLEKHRIMSSDDFTIKVLKDLLMEDNNERRRKKHSNE